tara:strand:- start:2681 stop:3007 length:327 start_codon:yes stop_codon:yes gene_type:complete
MANFIEPVENQTSSNFVDITSRYLDSTVFRYGDQKIITFETYKRKSALQSSEDRFFLISSAHEYRPDLVSVLAYGFPEWWWQILEANNIADVFDFKAGKTIRIPSSVQ